MSSAIAASTSEKSFSRAFSNPLPPDFTGEDVDRILRMWDLVDETITYNDAESIPPGFGPMAQSQHMTTMAKAALNSAELQLKRRHEEEAAAASRKNGRAKASVVTDTGTNEA